MQNEPSRRTGNAYKTSSPLLTHRLPPWRSRLVMLIMLFSFLVLLGRAAWIQLVTQDFYREQGRKRFERVIEVPAARGDILDRNGRLMAISRPLRAVYAMPSAMDVPLDDDQLAALADLLAMPTKELAARLDPRRGFVYLKRQVLPQVVARIDALELPWIRSFQEWRRFYPDGPASAQVVGFTDIDERGQEGVEAALDDALRPRFGRRVVIRNRLGEIVDGEMAVAPQRGQSVRLTIDARIQHAAFDALRSAVAAHGAQAGGAVVLDASSGEVLALANWPSFDPNVRRTLSGAALRNRVVTDTFEPGSTIKPIHIANALEAGWVEPNTMFDVSPGWIRLGRFTVRDVSPRSNLSVEQILVKSSNVGMVRMMLDQDKDAMWSMLQRAGFGEAPDIAFPGIASGKLRAAKSWGRIDHAAHAYGYGMSASLLQLARAYTMFGAEGRVMPLVLRCDRLMHARDSQQGDVQQSDAQEHAAPVISRQTAATVRKMLGAVTGPEGTARRARVDGFEVGVKTGTTRKLNGRKYAEKTYLATAVGIAPLDSPRYVVAVMVDDPRGAVRGGGAVAAPVFSRIMSETLRLNGVLPDAIRAYRSTSLAGTANVSTTPRNIIPTAR